MIKISISTLTDIIKICRQASFEVSGNIWKNEEETEKIYMEECKKEISAHMGLPDMFDVTYEENDSLHKDS